MAKTLADMTIKERADCVGMWAEHAHPHYDGLEVIIDSDHDSVTTISTKSGQQYIMVGEVMRHITPRFDLPRAWTPDGLPVPGEWEDGHVFVSYDEPDPWIVKDTVSIEGLSEGGMSYYEEPPNGIVVELDRFGEGEGKARRWVGEWEKNNER